MRDREQAVANRLTSTESTGLGRVLADRED